MKTVKWEDVNISLNYDSLKNKFRVTFQDGFSKECGRLSLIFKCDDPIKFIERVEYARFLK